MSFNYAGILGQVVAVWDDQHGSPVEADNPGVVFDFRAPWT